MKKYVNPFCKVRTVDAETALMAASNGPGNAEAGGMLAKPAQYADESDSDYPVITHQSIWDNED